MIEDEQEVQLVVAPTAAEYLADVLREVQGLAASAIRLAAQQSDWSSLALANELRISAEQKLLYLPHLSSGPITSKGVRA